MFRHTEMSHGNVSQYMARGNINNGINVIQKTRQITRNVKRYARETLDLVSYASSAKKFRLTRRLPEFIIETNVFNVTARASAMAITLVLDMENFLEMRELIYRHFFVYMISPDNRWYLINVKNGAGVIDVVIKRTANCDKSLSMRIQSGQGESTIIY